MMREGLRRRSLGRSRTCGYPAAQPRTDPADPAQPTRVDSGSQPGGLSTHRSWRGMEEALDKKVPSAAETHEPEAAAEPGTNVSRRLKVEKVNGNDRPLVAPKKSTPS